jgi:hypothetical protein
MRRRTSNRDRPPILLAAILLFGIGCTGDSGDPTSGRDNASVCCECACANDGIPCLNITVEGTEGESCPEICEAQCAAHEECPTVGAIATCTLLPPDDPNTVPGTGPCSEALDDETDSCEPNDSPQG